MAEGLLKVILRLGSEKQKALALCILNDALEKEESHEFRVKLPKKWSSGELKVKVGEPVEHVKRQCLRCGKTVWLEAPYHLCPRCREINTGVAQGAILYEGD